MSISSKTLQSGTNTEDLEELRKKYQLLDQERKNHYQQTQTQRQQNKEQIAKYQKENKDMKEMLKMISPDKGAKEALESTTGDRDLQVWRRKLDDLKNKSQKKADHLAGIQDKFKELERQQKEMTDIATKGQQSCAKPASSKKQSTIADNPLKQIRILENRLDKAMIKFNEAISIKKTYEIILKRLKEEKISYDKQLGNMERTIKSKQHDFDELLLLSHDANHARELAETDLKSYENQINTLRRNRMQDIQNQKAAVENRVNRQNNKDLQSVDDPKSTQPGNKTETIQNKSSKGGTMISSNKNYSDKDAFKYSGQPNKQRQEQFEKALFDIREATGLADVNQIIEKYSTQKDDLENLKDLKARNERELMSLTDKRQSVKDDLEKMKLEGLEAMTRKQVDDMERNLAAAEQKHEKAKEAHDKSQKMVLDLQAGIEHLCGKLNEVKIEIGSSESGGKGPENISSITQENLVEGLEQSRQKLKILYREMQEDQALFEEAMKHVQGGGLGGNQSRMFKDGPKGNFFSKPKSTVQISNAGAGPPVVSQNVRVKLPDNDDEQDDMSDIDPQAELAEEEMERLKIKHQAEMRKSKQKQMASNP